MLLTLGLGKLIQTAVLTNLSGRGLEIGRCGMPVSKKEISPCPIDAMLSVIDGRWKGTILWRLLDQPMRTSELRRSIPGITERMLIRHLQELAGDGIIVRHEEKSVPPCVRYSISEYGLTLVPVMNEICGWGRRHLQRMEMAACAS
jgi:DNA-binding HxlR family transcriptional regulator